MPFTCYIHCSWASFLEAVYHDQVPICSPLTDNLLFLNQQKRESFSMKESAGHGVIIHECHRKTN